MHRSLGLILVASLVFGAGAANAASDSAFLKKAMEGDNSEIHLGQMAEQHGASAGTRDFGSALVSDHTKAKTAALPVARAHNLGDDTNMAPEAKREAAKLQGLHGQAFDREFARYMVKDHKKDIEDFEREARSGDASTAALARQTLPDLRKHLAMAQKLAR